RRVLFRSLSAGVRRARPADRRRNRRNRRGALPDSRRDAPRLCNLRRAHVARPAAHATATRNDCDGRLGGQPHPLLLALAHGVPDARDGGPPVRRGRGPPLADGADRRSRPRDARVRRTDHARRDRRHRCAPRATARGGLRRSRHPADHAHRRLVQLHQPRGRRARCRSRDGGADMSRGGRRTGLVLAIGLLAALSVWYLGWGRFAGLPQPGSREYEEVTRAFYRALAELEVGLLDGAVNGFSAAAGLVPREPASWANLGLAHLRLGSFDEAAAALSRAAELAPDDGRIVFLLSRLETSRGNLDAGLEHLRRAVALDPSNVQARMALVQEIENAASPGADDEAQKLLEEILVLAPDNLAVLVERA